MISSLQRFHGHASLGYVYKRGQTVRTPQLSLKYALNQRRRTYRVAVVVSRKVDKSAVVRNRIRRRIYEVVRGFADDIREPYDLAFTVFSNQLADVDTPSLRQMVCECLEKARVVTSSEADPRVIVKPKR